MTDWHLTDVPADTQEMGDAVTAEPGSYVTMHYKYNDDTSKYDQTVSLNGTVVSRISTCMKPTSLMLSVVF